MYKLILTLASVSILFYCSKQNPTEEVSASEVVIRDPIAEVSIPEYFSLDAFSGKNIFEKSCIQCHGQHAEGRNEVAPPLIHPIYEPSHHDDESFQRAVALGVPAHHWEFGDMPSIQNISREDVDLVISYIRELQRFNDIY